MIHINADWICEFCYKPVTGNLPDSWEWIFQSAICPDCKIRAGTEGKAITEVRGGAYAFTSDPRAKPAPVAVSPGVDGEDKYLEMLVKACTELVRRNDNIDDLRVREWWKAFPAPLEAGDQAQPATPRKPTGLKDIDGREIFEGDEIEGWLKRWGLPTMGKVVYCAEHGSWANENEGGVTLFVEIDNIKVISPHPQPAPVVPPSVREAMDPSGLAWGILAIEDMEAGMYVYSTEAQRQQARNVFKSLNKQYPALLRFRLDTLASHPIQPQAPAETQGANHLRDAARAALDAFDAWMDNDDEDAAEALDKAFDTLREALPTPAAPRKDAQP